MKKENDKRQKDTAIGGQMQPGVSLRDCECEKWKTYIPIINGYIMQAAIRYWLSKYPKDGEFLYCPWCGERREAN
jgi:hypothetical protein